MSKHNKNLNDEKSKKSSSRVEFGDEYNLNTKDCGGCSTKTKDCGSTNCK